MRILRGLVACACLRVSCVYVRARGLVACASVRAAYLLVRARGLVACACVRAYSRVPPAARFQALLQRELVPWQRDGGSSKG